ncbi:MAG: FAD-binding oxidoreductase [bacterium]
MSRFHTLKVKQITRETAAAVSVGFDVPADLKAEYHYKAGQYLTLRFIMDGEEIRRSYSICSSPYEADKLEVAVKKVKGGKVSNFINDKLQVGDSVDVMIPMGSFSPHIDPTHKKNYVLFAGGSGITPMLSIVKAILEKEPKSTIVLLYGNNDEKSIIFKDEIESLALNHHEKFRAIQILATPPATYPLLHTGMMTVEKDLALIENYVGLNLDNEFFICGPGPMMNNAMAVLKQLKIDDTRIHIEYFSTPTTSTAPEKTLSVAIVKNANVTIIMDGDEYPTRLLENETILEAAKRIGLDAPYSCQNGSCSTCRAKLVEGKVHMKVNFALTPKDVAAHFILTCQSLPLTESVTVSYDEAV